MKFKEYFPMWDQLTPEQQNTLYSSKIEKTFSKGEIIHNGSIDCIGPVLICSGRLRAYTISEEGREITIYRLFERDICLLSASCMMRGIQFETIIEAEKETVVWIIPTAVYKSIMNVSAPLANYTNEIMASRFSEVMWLMDQIMWKSFDKRLAGFLVEEAALEEATLLKITHEAIGNHMGTAREVVTRMLRYFQNEEMVKLARGSIELLDINALETLRDS